MMESIWSLVGIVMGGFMLFAFIAWIVFIFDDVTGRGKIRVQIYGKDKPRSSAEIDRIEKNRRRRQKNEPDRT